MTSYRSHEPVFMSVPPVIGWLAGVIALVSAAALLLPFPWGDGIFAIAAIVIGMEQPQPLGPFAPYALHVFVHGGWGHLLLNMVALLAFGTGAARGLGPGWRATVALIAIFFLAAIAGGAAEVVRLADQQTVLVGASGGVFGLIAGAAYVYRGGPDGPPAPWSPAYLTGLAPWVALNLAIPLGAAFIPMLAGIAWVAHLGGLIVGAALYPLAHAWTRGARGG